MKCPYCKETIDDDSWFCDQCGKELHFCPECRQPKRGTECPACGADLVPPKKYYASILAEEIVSNVMSALDAKPQAVVPTMLEGDGFKLALKEGVFGRTTGIYPEFGSQIYISGRHGELRRIDDKWQIRDLGSHNGTFLNGARLATNVWTDLHVGDLLKIATTHLTVK